MAPGIGAEERGQAEAIAHNLIVMSRLTVPIISVVIGEGGSGGALALGVSDRVMMLEHSVYSVISPEGCAAILWDNPAKVPDAALSLKITAQDLLELGVIDEIIPEPLGGAHRDPKAITDRVAKALTNQLFQLTDLSTDQLLTQRDQKYRKMGAVNGLVALTLTGLPRPGSLRLRSRSKNSPTAGEPGVVMKRAACEGVIRFE